MKLDEIIEHFKEHGIPKGPIRYNECTVIHDPAKMVESHIKFLKGNPKNKVFLQYYKRLYFLVGNGQT